jgi:cation-dependent mannose-6-phosphate receptor
VLVIGALAVMSGLTTADSTEEPHIPCTRKSPNSGSFYDLRPILLEPDKGERTESWPVRGWDYEANFTMNICAPVIEDIEELEFYGVQKAQWRNVSAYYQKEGETYSIG